MNDATMFPAFRIPNPTSTVRWAGRAGRLVLLVLALCSLPQGGGAAVFVVDRLDDVAAANGCNPAVPLDCSLRTAVTLANASPGADEIQLPSGIFVLSIAGSGEDLNQTGDLDVVDDLVIVGDAVDRPLVDARIGGLGDSLLDIHGYVDVSIHDVDFQGDDVWGVIHALVGAVDFTDVSIETGSSGWLGGVNLATRATFDGVDLDGSGGDTWVFLGVSGGPDRPQVEIDDSRLLVNVEVYHTDVSVRNSTIQFNAYQDVFYPQPALRVHGSVDIVLESVEFVQPFQCDPNYFSCNLSHGFFASNSGSVSMTGCRFEGFQVSSVRIQSVPSASVIDTEFVDNRSVFDGGAIQLFNSTATIEGSTFVSNRADGRTGKGGAITVESGSSVVIRNSTFSDNAAGSGGALWLDPTSSAHLVHVTMSGNGASAGSAVFVEGAVDFESSLIDGDCAGSGTVTTLGGNLETGGSNSCGFSHPMDLGTAAQALLTPLNWWGGPTRTMLPLLESPARDALDLCGQPEDQRGAPRPFDAGGGPFCDAGAAEVGSPVVVTEFADGFESGGLCAWTGVTGFADGDDSEADALELPATGDCAGATQAFDGVLTGAGDVDFLALDLFDNALCVLAPRLVVHSTAAVEACVFVDCDGGVASPTCPAGATPSTSPDGHPGCCGASGTMDFDYSCPGADDDARLFIRINGDEPGCTPYVGSIEG